MKDNREDELSREIRAHLELDAEERVEDGAAPDEARYAARRAFGNVTRVREDVRAVWVRPWIEQTAQDLRYAWRSLRRAPAFAGTALVILIVGIGLNLALFQLLNVAALRPLPVARPDTLVRFDRVTKFFTSNGIPYPATQVIRRHNSVLAAVLTSHSTDIVWQDDPNDRPRAAYVSANWFGELGYGAHLGRLFSDAIDERAAAPPVVVVSHDFWRTRLQGEAVIGRAVRVNARVATIVGVAPEGFPGLRHDDAQVWLPIHQVDYFNPGSDFKTDWKSFNTQLYGRLRDGVSPLAAQQGLQPTLQELARMRPEEFGPDEALHAYTGRTHFRSPRDDRELRIAAMLGGGLTIAVLVVACANLSNLVLSHAIARLREFCMRAALGASRWRLVRQQLVESVLLATAGASGGLLLGHWCARIVAARTSMPTYLDFTPDWRMAAAAGAVALIATLVCGLIPAWMVSRRNIVGAFASLKDGGHQSSRGLSRTRLRLVSIAAQVAGCCAVLIVAGLMVRGLQRMLVGVGFEFHQIAVLDPALPRYGIGGEAARSYWTEVRRATLAAPDVEHVALTSHAPLGNISNRSVYNDAPRLMVTTMSVDPSFFPLMRIPILAGRNFLPEDSAAAVLIISRRLAIEMYGTVDAVGKGFPRSHPERTIVGVCADAALFTVTASNVAEQYSPIGQDQYGQLVLLARARTKPDRLLKPLADVARTADSRVLPKTWLPSTDFGEKLRARRFASLVATLTGLLALALACVGIFGLVAYTVSLRTKEIGIRRALGATRASVIGVVAGQLALPLAVGMILGALGGVTAGRVLEGDPFYLPSTNATAPLLALLLFALAAAGAALMPALRAVRTDPVQALRHE